MDAYKLIGKTAVFSLVLLLVASFTSCENPFMDRILQIKKVHFDTGDAGISDIEVTLYRGETVKPPVLPNIPKKKFGGWYKDKDCTQEWDFSTVPTGSITLFAKWNKIGLSGSGTPEDPWQIGDADDLASIGDDLGAYYQLTRHISLELKPGETSNWIPIGDPLNPFFGSFDGNGYTISGMVINGDDSMFSTNTKGTIKNFGLINVSITSTSTGQTNVGAVVGQNSGGTLENIYVTGTIISGSGTAVGGIVGRNVAQGKVINCFASFETINGSSNSKTGGIAGENLAIIKNSIAVTKEITANTVGRIAGSNSGMLGGNYAWEKMEVGGVIVSGNEDDKNGADMAADVTQSSAWVDAGFTFGNGEGQWVWNGNSGMPSLRDDGVFALWPGWLN